MKRGYSIYTSQLIGEIGIVSSEVGVEALFLEEQAFWEHLKKIPELRRDDLLCEGVKSQLDAYFRGERKTFTVAINVLGTPFRHKVWEGLTQIPYGETRSYGELAKMIGSPKAARAVGGANRSNPLPIIVPCHRVIGGRGELRGFMGQHTHLQEKLLVHERIHCGK